MNTLENLAVKGQLGIVLKDKDGNIDRKCQLCDNGQLSLKNSFRGGAFIGCTNYPECKFTRPLSKSKAAQQLVLAEPKLIGKNDNGKEIFLKNGRFGPYLQFEKEKIEEEIKNKVEKIAEMLKITNKLKNTFTFTHPFRCTPSQYTSSLTYE